MKDARPGATSATVAAMRLASLLPSVLLAGCVASAAAADPFPKDTLTLATGERLVGELLDVRDGRYWMLLDDGSMISVAFRNVVRVEMAGGAPPEPVAVDELPLPSWDVEAPAEEEHRAIGAGFDFGLTQGARVRFRIGTPAISHVDVRGGLQLLVGSGAGFGFITGAEIALFGKSPVHLTFSVNAGPSLVFGSFYPFVGAGPGVQFDPPGAMEVHLGLVAGTTFSSFAVVPDLSLSWVW
ncbi:MAG: hypothetical protein ACK4YP_17280 [Myxococcota bacterium]